MKISTERQTNVTTTYDVIGKYTRVLLFRSTEDYVKDEQSSERSGSDKLQIIKHYQHQNQGVVNFDLDVVNTMRELRDALTEMIDCVEGGL